MLESIKNIGEYVEKAYPNENPLDGMLNKIEGDSIKNVFEIDIEDNSIKTITKDFYKKVTNDSLFYQAGNGALGGGIRLDYFKDKEDEIKKLNRKIKSACEFCEVEDRYEEVNKLIKEYIKDKGTDTFVIIKVNGKTPRELFEKKFLDKMYSTMYKEVKGEHICHLCGNKGKVFNTTSYKFYTNDKEIYNNLNDKEKSGIVICGECLNKIIIGRRYINNNLKTYWVDNEVMFLPHSYSEEIASIYESTKINDKNEGTKFIDCIKSNEEDIIYEIGKTNSVTDIIFYEEQSKYFYIYHTIQSILPSRFTVISSLLKKYKLKLINIFQYTASVKITSSDIETTSKEKIKILDSIFIGKKIDRNLFFKKVMDVYKFHYLKDEHRKFACMYNINRIYGFLVECGCLEKGCNVMEQHKDYNELFEKNKSYFDSNEKKAWFILGKAYNTMIYYIKNSISDNNDGKEDIKTSLEKNFFFARKFDFKDFIYFSNLLEDKAIKYSINKSYFKSMMCETKEYMANREDRLSQDEAKYLFFWGLDSYFKNEKIAPEVNSSEGVEK